MLDSGMEEQQMHLRVSTGVDLCPAVSRQVAQDVRHFLKHGQHVNMDLNVDTQDTNRAIRGMLKI